MRLPVRLAAFAGAGALAFGLTACTLFESEEPAPGTAAPSESEAVETEQPEEEVEPGIEAISGEWSEEVDRLGGTLSIDAEGYLYVQAEGGPMEGVLRSGDDGAFTVEIAPAEGNPARGADEEPRQDWVLVYDAENDKIEVSETWSDGSVHETSYTRA